MCQNSHSPVSLFRQVKLHDCFYRKTIITYDFFTQAMLDKVYVEHLTFFPSHIYFSRFSISTNEYNFQAL